MPRSRSRDTSGTNTVLDITEGTELVLAARRDGYHDSEFSDAGSPGLTNMAGSFTLSSGFSFLASAIKPCKRSNNHRDRAGADRKCARGFRDGQRAFTARDRTRAGKEEPKHYTKALTLSALSVKDCAPTALTIMTLPKIQAYFTAGSMGPAGMRGKSFAVSSGDWELCPQAGRLYRRRHMSRPA